MTGLDSSVKDKQRTLLLLMAGFNVNAACSLFRYTDATHMLEGRADIREIQEYMGHADISTTQKYTHLSNLHLDRKYRETHQSALKNEINMVNNINVCLS